MRFLEDKNEVEESSDIGMDHMIMSAPNDEFRLLERDQFSVFEALRNAFGIFNWTINEIYEI